MMAARECRDRRVVLDLCSGTGELSHSLSKIVSANTLLLGLDFTRAMLRKAVHKRVRSEKGDVRKVNFILADTANLPLRNGCVDCIGMSFSFRNLVFRNYSADRYLKEILRVLCVGGSFVFIETSQPRANLLKMLVHFYLGKIMPLIGGFFSGFKVAYRYLAISAAAFPSAPEVKEMLEKIGFQKVSFKYLTFEIVAIHSCIK